MTQQLIDEYRILEKLDINMAKKLAQTFPQINFSSLRPGVSIRIAQF